MLYREAGVHEKIPFSFRQCLTLWSVAHVPLMLTFCVTRVVGGGARDIQRAVLQEPTPAAWCLRKKASRPVEMASPSHDNGVDRASKKEIKK